MEKKINELIGKLRGEMATRMDDSDIVEILEVLEQKVDETTYVVVVENEDDFLVTVKDDVNRPNNPDCEQVLRNWIYENYGSRECEYWILDGMTKVSL